MSKLDNVLSKLPQLASKAMPGNKFTFSMTYFQKDNTFQLTMSKDYGHQDGPMLFLSASGESTEDAAIQLCNHYQAWCNKQIAANNDEMMRHSARLSASTSSLMDTITAARELRDEAMDNQLS